LKVFLDFWRFLGYVVDMKLTEREKILLAIVLPKKEKKAKKSLQFRQN